MNFCRLLISRLRLFFNCIKSNYLICKYRLFIGPNHESIKNTGHVLIVKKLIYVDVSIHSILSFLFYNKNSRIIIHCDKLCFEKICETFSQQINIGRVEVKIDMEDSAWQLSKLRLFKSLPDESHCMFDVDARWNGKLVLETGVSYVSHNEFTFVEKSPWRWLIECYLNLDNSKNLLMLNTSFIRRSNFLSTDYFMLDDVFERLHNILDCKEVGYEDHFGIVRIAEQVAIAIYLQCSGEKVKAIVHDGRPRSGLLFETTYFGATGNTF